MAQKQIFSPSQNIASNPNENIWVQANAGTGKTTVLILRLLRILFRDSRSENNIKSGVLCLTYTNAAAGEMRQGHLYPNALRRSRKEMRLSRAYAKPGKNQERHISHKRRHFA